MTFIAFYILNAGKYDYFEPEIKKKHYYAKLIALYNQ